MKKTIKAIGGLPYLEMRNVPVEMHPRLGEGMHASVIQRAEQIAAMALITHIVPLRGLEIAFLRSFLGISMKEFGKLFGYSDVAVLKWERAKKKRVDVAVEHYIRLILVREFKIHVDAMELLGGDKTPKSIVLEYEDVDAEYREKIRA
jgi:DNA-binding transcriptional regulator YiaG